MRHIWVLFAAVGMMLTLNMLRVSTTEASGDPLVLAAVGFVVLASFTVGELVAQFRIPKITGYIVSGVVLGPQVSDILSKAIVTDMRVFNTLALGLIAMTAGLELDLPAIRKVLKTLTFTVLAKVPLLLLVVGGVTFLLERRFGFLGLTGDGRIMALALLMAVLGIGTSPAIALAVVNERRSVGRLTDLTLAIAVVKDLVVVILLAVAVTLAGALLNPDATLGGAALLNVAEELGASILFGALLGALFIAYIRFVHREMLFAVLVAVLAAAEVTERFHLELLLAFIVAGFVVKNFSKYQHELLHPLEKVSLPVFVVFFTTAGANVELLGTVALLPLALSIVAGRGLAYFGAGWIGARIGGETPLLGRNAWMAYFPQAGVTLSLVEVAAKAVPELADEIGRTGLALVAINLFVGPVLLSLALRRVDGTSSPTTQDLAFGEDPANEGTEPLPRGLSGEILISGMTPLPPPLQGALDRIGTRLQDIIGAFDREVLAPLATESRAAVLRLIPAVTDDRASMRGALVHHRADPAFGDLEARAEQAARALTEALEETPEMLEVLIDRARLRVNPEDGQMLRLRKRSAVVQYYVRPSSRIRKVPARLVARSACEAALVEAIGLAVRRWFLAYGSMIRALGHFAEGAIGHDECRKRVGLSHEKFLSETANGLQQTLRRCLSDLAFQLDRVDTPEAPVRGVRFTEMELRIRTELSAWKRDAPLWRQFIDASYDSVRARVEVAIVSEGVENSVHRRVWSAFEVVDADLITLARSILDRIEALQSSLEQEGDASREETKAKALEAVKELYPKRERDRFRGLLIKYRQRARSTELLTELSKLLESIPERLVVLAPAVLDAPSRSPVELVGREVQVATIVERAIIDRLVPKLAEAIARVTECAVLCESVLDEAVGTATYTVESIADDQEAAEREGRQSSGLSGLQRSRARVDSLLTELNERLKQARTDVASAVDDAQSSIESIAKAPGSTPTRVRGAATGTLRRAVEGLGRLFSRLVFGVRRLTGRARGLVRERAVKDWLTGPEQQHIDAAGMARYIERFIKPPSGLRLPSIYAKAFTTGSLEDPRLAVAYQEQMDLLVRAIQPGKAEDFSNVLITGEHGSGRTSMINLLELRVARHRVVRVDPRFYRRRDGLVRVMALELGCRVDAASILSVLRGRTHVLLLDDLEHYILPTSDGVADLEAFLDIVVRSSAYTHWVVTMERTTLAGLSELCPIENAFGRRIDLAPLNPNALRDVIEARRRLTGISLDFEPAAVLGFRLPMGQRRAEDDYYRELAETSGGNLRSALYAHLRSLYVVDDAHMRARAPRGESIPFLDQLSAETTAVLSLMLRFGPLEARTLSSALLSPESEVEAYLLPLVDAGIVTETSGRAFAVDARVERGVVDALIRQRVLPGVL
ncbi:MAG: cation:proton antiporter [Deltaproteobacteria bacterium]|nr:cation:proton antiporter [Deltaproteobacteria bacterium]